MCTGERLYRGVTYASFLGKSPTSDRVQAMACAGISVNLRSMGKNSSTDFVTVFRNRCKQYEFDQTLHG